MSGGRWRCASCERYLSHQDLQLCGLTAAALERFKNEASTTRDRVEFRSDKTFILLPTNKVRYNGRKRGAATQNEGAINGTVSQRPKLQVVPEAIEID